MTTSDGAQPMTEPMTESMTMVAALNAGLRAVLEDNPRTLLMGEDIATLGGVFRVTDGLAKDFGERRVIDTPLAEAGILGTAIGLAMSGYVPIVEIQFDGFVYPAFDQIVTQLAKHHYRSGGDTQLPIVIRIPFGGGIGAVEHHSESPEAYFVHTPGLRVWSPADAQQAYTGIQAAVACPDPIIFLEPKRRYWDKASVVLARPTPAELDQMWTSRTLRTGTDVTLVAYGPMVRTCVEAAESMTQQGISATVIDLRSLSPLDLDPVFASVRQTGRCVMVHEAVETVGLGAEISARISEECFFSLEAPVLRVGAPHVPYPPSRFERHYLPNIDRVVAAVQQVMAL
ncbi:MAG: alpha-ketoacid dehydrogenase subunit beta [Candidatus Nanopelagicales bacterium]